MAFQKPTVLVTSDHLQTLQVTTPLPEEITFLTSCSTDSFCLVLNFIQIESPNRHSFAYSFFHSVLCFLFFIPVCTCNSLLLLCLQSTVEKEHNLLFILLLMVASSFYFCAIINSTTKNILFCAFWWICA